MDDSQRRRSSSRRRRKRGEKIWMHLKIMLNERSQTQNKQTNPKTYSRGAWVIQLARLLLDLSSDFHLRVLSSSPAFGDPGWAEATLKEKTQHIVCFNFYCSRTGKITKGERSGYSGCLGGVWDSLRRNSKRTFCGAGNVLS